MKENYHRLAAEAWDKAISLYTESGNRVEAINAIQAAIEKATECKIADFVLSILHGDEIHKAWLREAGEAFITNKPIPAPRDAKKHFACVVCSRGANEVGILHRVSRKGDTKPVIWICHDHFNYEDWKFVDDNNERLSKRAAHASETSCLGRLLAVIHGDGGHYQTEYGSEKATKDALDKYHKLLTRLDGAEYALSQRPTPATPEINAAEAVDELIATGIISQIYREPALNLIKADIEKATCSIRDERDDALHLLTQERNQRAVEKSRALDEKPNP